MNSPRLIPVVSLIGDEAVKTKAFKNPVYVGDPVNTVSLFSSFEAEELVVLDISKSFNSPPTAIETLVKIIETAYMPISFGGGVSNLEIADKMFSIGFDKVVLRSELLRGELPQKIASKYGSQALTGCLDVSYSMGDLESLEVNGVGISRLNVNQVIDRINESQIGELIIHDKSREGSRSGLVNNWLGELLLEKLKIPLVQLGGCADLLDAARFVSGSGFHSVAASTMFLFRPTREAVLINYPETEDWLRALENDSLER